MADYTGVIYQDISVDVSEPNQFAPLLVAQGDAYTRGLVITITQHGEKLNIPNTGVNASLNACNMADNSKKASTMATINSDGTITAIIPSVVMEVAGYVQCDISIIGSNGSNATVLKSTVFYLNCEASADTDGSSQPPEDDVITAAIASIAGKVDSSVYNQKIDEIEQNKANANHTHPIDSALSQTSTNPIQNKVVTGKFNEIISNVNAQLAGKVDSSVYNQKIDEIEQNKANANHTHPIDSALSQTSTNPIQNKVITGKLNEIISNVNNQLTAKADKATKLAGYGITDAYTKSEAEERIDESFELKTLFPNNSGSSDGYLINEVISPGSSGYRDEYCCLFGGATHATGLDALTPENFGESYHIEIFLDNVNIRGIIFQELRTGESGGINYPSAWNVSLSQDEYTSLSGTKIEHDYTMGATTTSIFRMRLRCNGNNRQQVRVRITKNRGLERTSNKVTVIDPNTATDEQYTSALAVVNYINSVLGRGASQND